ncbi:acylneuraminate cytidylyltransferase family protein [Psychroflexus sp. CAK57W]|uniref:acylneuraminate cytidylyltransferase family protein n=1 Tax=Psychroflexus curvus TaxID=2873595 RepID=UPI001CCF3E4B|nr:acylneuraminate cytidylyltransferase family protein [Psychroflexus curvus]MBZ9787835.1 acylneuraminate cytidylyltransferase family protein [Psychroflexus curvus]
MRVLGIIPARGGSKGIPGKNIKTLGGKPLLYHTIDAAKESRLLSQVILSSDDAEIIDLAKSVGLEVPFVRPAHLATDQSGSLEVVQHALNFFVEKGEVFDAVCLLQPTTPFRESGSIDKAIQKFAENSFDSLISVREVPAEFNPHWVFEADEKACLQIATGENEIIKRRQDLPKAYFRDGSIYLTKTDVLLKQHSLYGKRIGYIVSKGERFVNLDTPEDWIKAEKMLNENKK